MKELYINHLSVELNNLDFHRLEVASTHNFKWVKITHICLIWDKTFANVDVQTHISFRILVIQSANKT